MEPIFFESQDKFREWLKRNHLIVDEQWVGYYKKASKIPSIDWNQSVDEALCFGWIDGLRKSIDDISYKIRFTPRRKGSHWSNKNIHRIKELIEEGKVTEAGMKAFELQDQRKAGQASYEQAKVTLDPAYLDQIKSNQKAWSYYQNLSPYIKKISVWFVMSAKKEETRLRRLKLLIDSCENKQKLPQLRNDKE